MQVTIDIPEEVVARAKADGLTVEEYVLRRVEPDSGGVRPGFVRFGPGSKTPEEAGADILELQKRTTLGGLKIKDLINEGRRY